MSDSARLASQAFSLKPPGVLRTNFQITSQTLSQIEAAVPADTLDAAFSAAASYAEAIRGIKKCTTSWALVKLYYSAFYAIRAIALDQRVVPFHCRTELLLDLDTGRFLAGGKSSHVWNWTSLNSIQRLKNQWMFSQDSQDTYGLLRKYREEANYTHPFPDPELPKCLVTPGSDLSRNLKAYKEDSAFFFTYLTDHSALAYPTKLVFSLDTMLRASGSSPAREKLDHLKSVWELKERCPLI